MIVANKWENESFVCLFSLLYCCACLNQGGYIFEEGYLLSKRHFGHHGNMSVTSQESSTVLDATLSCSELMWHCYSAELFTCNLWISVSCITQCLGACERNTNCWAWWVLSYILPYFGRLQSVIACDNSVTYCLWQSSFYSLGGYVPIANVLCCIM